jgi:hypothetical protein
MSARVGKNEKGAAASKNGAKAPKTMSKGNARTGNVYDRIAEARARREIAPAKKAPDKDAPAKATKATPNKAPDAAPAKPFAGAPANSDKATPTNPAPPASSITVPNEAEAESIRLSVREAIKTQEAANTPDDPSQFAQEKHKKRGVFFWVASSIIAAMIIGYVAQRQGPAIQTRAQSSGQTTEDNRTTTAVFDAPNIPLDSPALGILAEQPVERTAKAAKVELPSLPDQMVVLPDDNTIAAVPDFNPSDYRIALHAPQTVNPAAVRIALAGLEEVGFSVAPRSVNLSISQNNVRYYHAADAEAARIVANATQSEARDFTEFRPSPPEGLIEIWLAGRAVVSSRETSRAETNHGTDSLKDLSDLGKQIRRLFGQR